MYEIKKWCLYEDWKKLFKLQAERTLALAPIPYKIWENIFTFKENLIRDIVYFYKLTWYAPTWEHLNNLQEYVSDLYSWRSKKVKDLTYNWTFFTPKDYCEFFFQEVNGYFDKNIEVYDLFSGIGSLASEFVIHDTNFYVRTFEIDKQFIDFQKFYLDGYSCSFFNEDVLEYNFEWVKQIIANPPFGKGFDFDVFTKLVNILDKDGIMALILPWNFYDKFSEMKKWKPLFEQVELIREIDWLNFEFKATKASTSIFIFRKL